MPDVGPLDASVRLTTTTICGTDVHILRGEYPVRKGLVIGHEPVGIIEKLGTQVAGCEEGPRGIAGAIKPSGHSYAWAASPPDVPRSPIGWQIDPAAFRDTLLDAHDRYGVPIHALENGAGAIEKPDASGEVKDQERIDYLALYTDALRQAVALGADVRGYFVWSLLDNFEWGAGYATRFGLVYVDYATQRRTLKASAHWYARLIQAETARASP